MIAAVKSCWTNTGVTASDIRRVYYREPCLVCVLAKRNKDSENKWSRRYLARRKRKKETAVINEKDSNDNNMIDTRVSLQ